MTNPIDTAFPCTNQNGGLEQGLTKREYFAALAMQGLLANEEFSRCDKPMAEEAVLCADELIRALNK